MKVSIIIPVYNDPDGLDDTLSSLVIQDYPNDELEIIVVDNGSDDLTFEIAKNFEKKYPEIINVEVEDQIQGSYAARNMGIKHAKGDILIFIDSNITVYQDYVSRVVQKFKNSSVDYLGCNVKMLKREKTIASKYNFLNGFNIKKAIENDHYTPTCNLSIKKRIINQLGIFDERLEGGGDFEFGERVYEGGFELGYANEIILYHPTRHTYLSLIKKAQRVGRANAQLAYYYPFKYQYLYDRHFKIKKFIPKLPKVFYSQLIEEKKVQRIILSLLFAFYHIPLMILLAYACLKEKRRLLKIK